MIRAHFNNLVYMLRHKWYVFLECRKLNVPLWVALTHDWDKLLPDVWFPYVHAHAPAKDGIQQIERRAAFTQAKMIHQHRSKHHWQFWVFINDCGEIEPLPMPDLYRREMLADWRGAGKAMGKPDLLEWYSECREAMLFHPETRLWLEQQLGYVDPTNP
jgi:hypothetical protein